MVTAQSVKELRERTGAGMMACKKALVETDGDMEKAIEVLREKGLAAAAKKAGRIASEGLIGAYISDDNKKGALVEINCETDFVAKNQDFISFVNEIAKTIVDTNVNTVEELLAVKFGEDTVELAVKSLIAKIGENINIRRFEKFDNQNGYLNSYIHGERIGVMIQVACEKASDELQEVTKQLALQIASMNPIAISSDAIPQDKIEVERQVARTQAEESGKPANIIEKMVEGRIKKYFKEVCLLEQAWVKDGDKSISAYLNEESKKIGAPITVSKFVRFEKGEGIEKKVDDFAEEVARQMGK